MAPQDSAPSGGAASAVAPGPAAAGPQVASPARRNTLRGIIRAGTALALAVAAGQSTLEVLGVHLGAPEGGHSVNRFVMVVDLAKCDGCRKCTNACQVAHHVPAGQEWIKVYTVEDGFGGSYFLPRPCQMCEDPPCRNVCPTGATFKDDDGLTLIDHDRCIGCRYCLAACPYSARYFNWTEPAHTAEELAHEYSAHEPWPHRKGVAEKCTFCVHLRSEGKLPYCVGACPTGALYFGDAAEDGISNSRGETLPLRKTLSENSAYRLREDLGTGPSVYYLPRRGGV